MTIWNLDSAHSEIGFVVRHMVFAKVRGKFTAWSGTLVFDPQDPGSARATATIETASIDTGNADRDGHLRSADFFDAEAHPTITFESTDFRKEADHMVLVGDLTMHGVTRPVELRAEHTGTAVDPWGNTRAGFNITGEIDRTEWGLKWNQALEAGGVLVGETVKIAVELQATKAEEEAA